MTVQAHKGFATADRFARWRDRELCWRNFERTQVRMDRGRYIRKGYIVPAGAPIVMTKNAAGEWGWGVSA